MLLRLKLVFFISFCTLILQAQNLEEILKSVETISIPETKLDSSAGSTGDLKKSYWFTEANSKMPYRLYVPSTYHGKKSFPLIVMLHGGNSDENKYVDKNNRLLFKLAEKYGYILVSPLGFSPTGAYGSFLRLPAVFGKQDEVEKLRLSIDSSRWKTLELSEKDVMNVLDIVKKDYKIDKDNIFLMGHSMGSGGTWYLGAKNAELWKALAPMSGPFIDEKNYPFDKIKTKPIFVSEGTLAPASLEGSRLLAKYLTDKGFKSHYMEVVANHGDMVALVLPSVFNFFNEQLNTYVASQVPVTPPRLSDTMQSVIILPDNKVLFRIKGPKATEVSINGDFTAAPDTTKMQKDASGMWSVILGPLKPDLYSYEFTVDGVRTIDPRNALLRESMSGVANLFVLPGAESAFLAERNVPHGTIEKVWYHSKSLNLDRRLHIYFPPNYHKIKEKLPVLYLLHGGSGNDATWTTIGRANFILDNLYAEGKIQNMIVVMPSGQTPLPTEWMAAGLEKDPFLKDFFSDIIPLIEQNYNVSTKRSDRAIAGLSMGGVQVLNISLFSPEKFDYVAPMGTGYFPSVINTLESENSAVLKNPELNKIKNYTFYMGNKDPVAYNNGKNTRKLFEKNGIKFQYIEEEGGHRQNVFRRNFYDFVQKIFK